MPSASTIYAAYSALRDACRAEPSNVTGSLDGRGRQAEEAMKALEPLVGEEAERLAAEAQGYVDRRDAA